jgi:hypothetical protein
MKHSERCFISFLKVNKGEKKHKDFQINDVLWPHKSSPGIKHRSLKQQSNMVLTELPWRSGGRLLLQDIECKSEESKVI